MKLKFYKMQGCGNDFLFLDYMNTMPPRIYNHEILYLCDRHFGIGADGLVVLHESKEAHAAWKFYNSDGSEAEMCGNAARCAIRFLQERYYKGEELVTIETKAGIIKGRKLDGNKVEIAMFKKGNEEFKYEEKFIPFEDKVLHLAYINTGVPHLVYETKDLRSYPIEKVGAFLSKHEAFPQGTNVTFYERLVGPKILSTTYERGCYKETFACGTGATAAAIIYSEQYLQPFPIEVNVPGGDLTVDISPVSKMVLLQGPADYVMDIELDNIPHSFEQPRLYSEGKKK